MNAIPQYCQKCREKNVLGESNCRRCGARLMLVVFPQSLKYDTNHVPTYYEDHLLERVTALELRLAQVTERLAATLDLMLRQTKTAHSDHLLLETLIESLNSIGALEKDKLTENLRERIKQEQLADNEKKRREKTLAKILVAEDTSSSDADLFRHLVVEGIGFLNGGEEKQGLRTLERASAISPLNTALLLFIALYLFRADKLETAKAYLEKAISISSKNPEIRLLLAVIYINEGNIEQAQSLIDNLPANEKLDFCIDYQKGIINALKEDWNLSLTCFKKAAQRSNSPEIHYLIGCVYFQLKRYKMAIRQFEKIIEHDRSFADVWFMLSVAYEVSGEMEKSRESVENAWNSKEPGAQCLEFLKRKLPENLETALPFLHLRQSKNRILASVSPRLLRVFNEELFRALN